MPTIGGNVVIRNGNKLDYCWKETINSLIPVCDTITVCDGESDDGTYEELKEWADREPKISVIVWEWKNAIGTEFAIDWINYCRERVNAEWHICLEPDEVLHEQCYPEVLEFVNHGNRSAFFTKLNFWGDHRHTIPEGFCLGKYVIRLAPKRMWMPADIPSPKADEICAVALHTGIQIFHYNWMRKKEAYFEKEKFLQDKLFRSHDCRLESLEKSSENWMFDPCIGEWTSKLDPFTGTHPSVMKDWLIERGHK